MKAFLAIALVASLLTGCSSVQVADEAQDQALKTFKAPTANTAGLYIYRNESMGGAVKMEVEVDGKEIGRTARKTYLYKEVTPGKHTVTSKAENTDTLEIDVKPGTLNYVWQEVKMGILYARTKLNLVSETEGKQGVLESVLVETK
jgi:hypothetical protein